MNRSQVNLDSQSRVLQVWRSNRELNSQKEEEEKGCMVDRCREADDVPDERRVGFTTFETSPTLGERTCIVQMSHTEHRYLIYWCSL